MTRLLAFGMICIVINTAPNAVAATSDPLKTTWAFPPVEKLPVHDGRTEAIRRACPEGTRRQVCGSFRVSPILRELRRWRRQAMC
mgnify:CR=1 FL=1